MNQTKDIISIVLIGILVFLLSIILGIVINDQLDSPQLCNSCHEMAPYYDSYINPPNGSIISLHKLDCIQCHANKSLWNARKNILAELIVYKMNFSSPGIIKGELTPDCKKCHLPNSPIHKDLNQMNCTDCHWAHRSNESLKDSNVSLLQIIPYGPHKNKTCDDCHGNNFEIPRCVKCHSGHGGQKLENNLCLNCHTDPHVPTKPGILRNNTVNFTGDMPFSVCEPCHESQFLNITTTPSQHKDMGTCIKCHSKHGEKPQCKKCHERMMIQRHPKSFNCSTCHLPSSDNTVKCQDCHGTSHEWSAFTAIINPK